MTRNLTLLLVLCAAAFLYGLYAENRSPKKSAETQNTFPEIADAVFFDLGGKKHNLHDFKGKPVVLNFWASWCAPCVIEFPQMLKLAEKAGTGTVFLFLSLDEDKSAIERFLKEQKQIPKNVVIGKDEDKKISRSFGTYKLPETYFIAPDLTVRDKIIGANVNWNGEAIRNRLNKASR
jgi:thiol-disulfide isomerase/thioredoxin